MKISSLTLRNTFFRLALFLFFLLLLPDSSVFAQKTVSKTSREYIEIRVYHTTDSDQLATIDRYVQSSLFPALEKAGFTKIGAFKAIDNDTAKDKRFYVIISLSSLSQLEKLNGTVDQSLTDSVTARAYTNAVYNAPPYSRFETILLQAFEGAPRVKPSRTKSNFNEKVYELRSYESATEALHRNKVKMFNSGEIDLFQRLGFNAVFYGQVIAGSQMPNLMYVTSFDNKASRDEHWKTFGGDPAWKAMSSAPEYQHNVSKNTSIFLRPTSYSRL